MSPPPHADGCMCVTCLTRGRETDAPRAPAPEAARSGPERLRDARPTLIPVRCAHCQRPLLTTPEGALLACVYHPDAAAAAMPPDAVDHVLALAAATRQAWAAYVALSAVLGNAEAALTREEHLALGRRQLDARGLPALTDAERAGPLRLIRLQPDPEVTRG